MTTALLSVVSGILRRKWGQVFDRRTVLAVTCDDRCRMRLRILALEEGWRILFAGSPDEALRLCTGTRSVLIYDHDLSGVDWRCGLRLLAADQPVIPIVIAQSPSARLRSDVLDCGGYDLACNPLDAESFVLLVKSALALAEAIDSAVPEM